MLLWRPMATVLAHGTLRIFDRKQDTLLVQAGNAPQGGGYSGDRSYVAISVNFMDLYHDAAHATTGEPYRRDLQQLLAHELDHLSGLGEHADAGTWTTTHKGSGPTKVAPLVTLNQSG